MKAARELAEAVIEGNATVTEAEHLIDLLDEPDGYVVTLADTSSAPHGEWFVVAYHDKDLADAAAAKHSGTRVRPIKFLDT